MKKKILGGIVVLAIAAVAALNVNFSASSDLSDISLTNVDALANSESSTPSVSCPGGSTLCATVNAPTGTFKYYKQ